jgi:hypothetical protein
MKKQLAAILIILGVGIFSWAQTPKDIFDGKKSQAEMEIMKGILGTTLSYVTQGQKTDAWRFNASSIGAYYLYGQGAVFTIPTSGLRRYGALNSSIALVNPEMFVNMQTLMENTQELELQASALAQTYKMLGKEAGKGTGKTKSGDSAAPAPPAPPAAPAVAPNPPAAPSPFKVDREELRKKIEDYQTKIKKSREEAEADREKFLQSLNEIKGYLVEALANYGDSLTTVKPNEYVNLVLSTDGLDSDFSNRKPRHDVISAQKSWITDYKAGRLNLDGFKQKVLQYTE